ncbi:FtsK/SpoIIIE domain-containing protein, partial [Clostridium botulinum]
EKAKDVLETAYGEKIFIVQNDNLKTATISIITYKIDESTRFKPIETKPYEIFAGYSYKAEPLISNLNKFPHVLVSGQTGCGKTELIRLIITNNIHNYSDRDFNIYFSDLSDSCDFDIFKNCKQTKGYSETLEDSEKLFEHLIHVYKKRLNIFSKNSCKNIIEYNNKNFNKRMSYIWVVLDEFADYFPTNRLDKEYMQKVNCYNLIKNLVRKARKVGMFLLIGIQRPDTTVLDPSLKSCLCTKFGFSQNNDASSLVVCDSVELSNIDNREALFMYGNKREWFKTL